jgi:hypothetical protein
MSVILQSANRFHNFGGDELYFPVSLQEFEVPYGSETATANEFRAVVNESTGRVMAVHGEGYNLIRNEHLVPEFEDTLKRSDLDLTDMYTRTHLLDDGGAFVKAYHLPAYTIEPRVGDVTELVMKLKGSYNGRWSTMFEQGANRLVCTNGMVSMELFTKAFGRHTKGFKLISLSTRSA